MALGPAVANPAGAFGVPLAGTNIGGSGYMANDGAYCEVVNGSTGTRQYGDVMVWATGSGSGTSGTNVTTTTITGDHFVAGVVSEFNNPPTAVAVGAAFMLQYAGVARVNIGTGTVAQGAYLATNGAAGQAFVVTAGTAVTVNTTNGVTGDLGSIFAIALESQAAKDSNNTIRCKLFGGMS